MNGGLLVFCKQTSLQLAAIGTLTLCLTIPNFDNLEENGRVDTKKIMDTSVVPLPNQLKAFSGNKLNVAQMVISGFEKDRRHSEKGRKC